VTAESTETATTGGSGPGFGVVGAVLAVLGAALLVCRHI
jgi:PGF-CTERM protein